MSIKIRVLPADEGDAIIVNCIINSFEYNVVVDGGNRRSYWRNVKPALVEDIVTKKKAIDLVIITHIDEDHIGGILEFIRDDEINKG